MRQRTTNPLRRYTKRPTNRQQPTYILTAASLTDGDIRTYETYYRERIKDIANTDFREHGHEQTLYVTSIREEGKPERIIDKRIAEGGKKTEILSI